MPNRPKTPLHSFRVDDELWEAAKAAAEANGEALSDVLRAALQRYVRRHSGTSSTPPAHPGPAGHKVQSAPET